MAIPGFQEFMLPALKLLSDKRVWPRVQLREAALDALGIVEPERSERNPRGRWIAAGRVSWAVVYLNQAGLLSRVSRGHVQITDRGLEVLGSNPSRIDAKFLKQFPEFLEFLGRTRSDESEDLQLGDPEAIDDPHQTLSDAVSAMEGAVASELLQRMKAQSPAFLEHAILKLMVAMGYAASPEMARHLGGPGDGGFDGVIHADALGLERVFLQAKRYEENAISRKDIQAFTGALSGAQATKGVFITTSRFTSEAKEFARTLHARVILIDGDELARLMVKHRVGVHVKEVFEIVEIDEDFFED